MYNKLSVHNNIILDITRIEKKKILKESFTQMLLKKYKNTFCICFYIVRLAL